MVNIPFNKPYLTGKEAHYIYEAVYKNRHVSGNGEFTKRCHQFFEDRYGFKKCLLTTSCTDALEMTSLLIGVKPGDEVIVPSYTFVSSALAFVRQGATVKFVDSRPDHPGMDENKVEELVTNNTKVIVVVHYAGVACDMNKIMSIAKEYNLFVVEDAAQAIDSYYNDKPLGVIGHFGCFSFHETKNIQCGEGGMLVINDENFIERAEILWEKGTNRAQFFRGEINKYGWVDIGSSFLPSDILAAFLYAQIESMDEIQNRRKSIFKQYYQFFENEKNDSLLPKIPDYATNNGHMYYLILENEKHRQELIDFLKSKGVHAVFHYISLHTSDFYKGKHDGRYLPNSLKYTETLLRLPYYYELKSEEINLIAGSVIQFYKKNIHEVKN